MVLDTSGVLCVGVSGTKSIRPGSESFSRSGAGVETNLSFDVGGRVD